MSWHCPNCLRKVPSRAERCHCGTTRADAQRVVDRSAPPEGGPPWTAIGLVLAAAAVAAIALSGGGPSASATDPPDPAPTPAATPAALRTPPTRIPGGRRMAPVHGAATPAPSTPREPQTAEPAPAPAEPAPEPTPEPTPDPDSLEVRREQGEAALEAALSGLKPRLDEVSRRLRSYQSGCRSSTSAVQPTGCGAAALEIADLLDEIDRGVADAELQARRSWVAPGTSRDLLRRHRLDDASRQELRRSIEDAFR